jgi:hypothetical protein
VNKAQPNGQEFSFSVWARVSTWAEMFFSLLLAGVFILIATSIVDKVHGIVLWMGVIALYASAAIFLSRAYWRVRYRHIFDTRYLVADDGVTVEDERQNRHFGWEKFTEARYLPLVPVSILVADELSQPIVIFMIRDARPWTAKNREIHSAYEALKKGLGTRLRTSWLLW